MEPTRIPQRDLRNHSARILREVLEGREFVITVRGTAVARLIPEKSVEPVGPRTFVPREETEAFVRRAQAAFTGVSLRDIRDAVDNEPRY